MIAVYPSVQKNGTVTFCHPHTGRLHERVSRIPVEAWALVPQGERDRLSKALLNQGRILLASESGAEIIDRDRQGLTPVQVRQAMRESRRRLVEA
jgi:hypothetical protein